MGPSWNALGGFFTPSAIQIWRRARTCNSLWPVRARALQTTVKRSMLIGYGGDPVVFPEPHYSLTYTLEFCTQNVSWSSSEERAHALGYSNRLSPQKANPHARGFVCTADQDHTHTRLGNVHCHQCPWTWSKCERRLQREVPLTAPETRGGFSMSSKECEVVGTSRRGVSEWLIRSWLPGRCSVELNCCRGLVELRYGTDDAGPVGGIRFWGGADGIACSRLDRWCASAMARVAWWTLQ